MAAVIADSRLAIVWQIKKGRIESLETLQSAMKKNPFF